MLSPGSPLYGWFGFNRTLFLWINGIHAPWWDTAMAAISRAGSADTYPYWIAAALIVAWRSSGWMPLRSVVAFAAGYVATGFLVPWIKAAAAMPRPSVVLGNGMVTVIGPMTHGATFPSGHAAFAVLIAATLGHRAPRLLGWLLWIFAGLVALSRVAVGAHFPADVVGGALLGLAVALVMRTIAAIPRTG
jgi:undecaprenyl-diphosphatase